RRRRGGRRHSLAVRADVVQLSSGNPKNRASTIRHDLSVTNQGTDVAGGRMRIRRFVTALAACTTMAMSLPAGDASATDQAILHAPKTEGKPPLYPALAPPP